MNGGRLREVVQEGSVIEGVGYLLKPRVFFAFASTFCGHSSADVQPRILQCEGNDAMPF
jgi:hypothetical protein